MKIEKVINNNLVKAYNSNNQEVLVMGCGIGFKKKRGENIDESIIEKIYVNEDKSNKLIKLLQDIDLEFIKVANEIISFARFSLGKNINDNIHISLTDHINYAVERAKNGLYLKNTLLLEIKRFYNHEYLIGKEAVRIINERFSIELPEDEAGFIAFHIINATTNTLEVTQVTQMTQLIQNILNIVKDHFNVELDEYSIHYERFITHLKFFAQRIFNNTIINNEDENFIFTLKEQYKKEYECTVKIRDYILKEFNKELTEEEMIYLTIHIKRITTN